MPAASIDLKQALDLARTGDVWLFRGHSAADRAIRVATNSPVNHVGMSVVIDDLPPLMWHAELGRSLPDLWSGSRHRGVQLHDLRDAVTVWATRYGQRAWLRQLEPAVTREMEDAVLRTIARLDGTPFPSTTRLASRWLFGRAPAIRRQARDIKLRARDIKLWTRDTEPRTRDTELRTGDTELRTRDTKLETAYCAEVLAITYQAMGLLPGKRDPGWFDAGRFWSGDNLGLTGGYRLGGEIAVRTPDSLETAV